MAIVNIPKGTEDWDDEVNGNFTDLDTRVTTAQSGVTTAQATADLALASAGSAPARPTFGGLDQSPETVVWGGSSGHVYSSVGPTGSYNLNDTMDYVVGSRSIKMTTDGLGGQAAVGVYGGPSMDMRNKIPSVWIKVVGQAKMLDFKIWIGKSAFADSWVWNLKENPTAWPYIREGQWVRLTLPLGKAAVNGDPWDNGVRRALTDFQIVAFDDSTGPVDVQWNNLTLVPEAPGAVISFTFDDNLLSQYTTAKPLMDAKGYKGTLYPITGILKDIANPAYVNYFGLSELHEFQDQGWDVGTHADSVTLHNQTVSQGGAGANGYAAYTSSDQSTDMREAKNYLLSNGFLATDHFAYPQGAYDETVRTNVAQFFSTARGLTNPTYESIPLADRLNVRSWAPIHTTPLSGAGSLEEAVDKAIAGGDWLIFTLHQVVTTPTTSIEISTADFTGLLDYIASKGVPVRTVSEVVNGTGVPEFNKTISLRDGSTPYLRINIPDDALTSSGPDRLAFWFGTNTRAFAINEYGEARMRPGKIDTVAARVFGWGGGGTSSGDVFQVVNGANSLVRFRISETDAESIVPFKVTDQYVTFAGVRFYVAAATPTGTPPDGSVWLNSTTGAILRRSAGAWV